MNIFALLDFVNIFIAVFIGAYVFSKDTSSKINRLFLINCLLAAYTGFCEYFRLTAVDEQTALLWHRLSFVWPFFPAIFAKFVLYLSDNKYNLRLSTDLLLLLPPAYIAALHLFTNLLYGKLNHYYFGWSYTVTDNMFSLVIPFYVVSVSLMSIFLLLKLFFSQKEKLIRRQIFYAIVGLFIPLVTGFLTEAILPALKVRIPPVTPISFLLGTYFLSISILKYKFFISDPISTLQKVLETIDDFLIIYNDEGRIYHASSSFIKCISNTDEPIVGTMLGKYFYSGGMPVEAELIKKTGKEIELNLMTDKKEIIPLSVVSSLVSDNSRYGNLYLLLGRDLRERKRYEKIVFSMQRELEEKVIARTTELAKANHKLRQEIEERINIELALRKSEKSYKDLFNNSPIGIFRTTPDGKFVLANPALLKMLKYDSIEELYQVNLEADEHLAQIYSRSEFKQKIESEGEIIGVDVKLLRKDNTIVFVRENARCIYNSDGSVLYYDGTLEDITEQVNADEALKESEEKFKILAEQAPNIIVIYSEGRILYVNNKATEMLGYTKDELTSPGFNYSNFIVKNFNNNISFDEFVNSDKALVSDMTFKNKEGRIIDGMVAIRGINYSGKKALLVIITDITERIRIERKLKESEERYRGLVENINELYYISGYHGRVIYVSPNIESFSGFQSWEIIGKSTFQLVYEPDMNRVILQYINGLKNGVVDLSVEFRSKKKDNSIIWVEQLTRIIRDDKGNLFEYRCVARDVTERKNTENALKESEGRYRSIFENTSAVMLLIDPLNGTVKGANKAAALYYGYNNDDFLKMKISDIDISPDIDPIPLLVNPDEKKKEYFRHKLSGGEERDVEVHSGIIKINYKDVIFAIVSDITERRQAERQLEEYKMQLENLVAERTRKLNDVNKLLELEIKKLKTAEENIQDQVVFLRTLIDTIPNPIYIRDTNRIYKDCNIAFAQLHGRKREEMIGQSIYEFASFVSPELIDKRDEDQLANPGELKFDLLVNDYLGNKRDMVTYRATFRKNDGTIGGIVGILFDITEIKKLEKEVRVALDKEIELSELKSRFISVASHEFRTPLTSILSSADLLELYGRKWPEKKYYEYIGHIQKAVEYMTELINDVLTVSRADTNKVKFNPERIDFHQLVNNIVENARISAPNKIGINYNYKINKEILYLDKKLITQIVTNLVTNAIKYSPEGGIVDLTVDKDEAHLIITVHDQGIGIPEEDLNRLFEPFHRGNNVGAISGTGLGLSIAKKSAEIHHGDILVTSKVNKGTTFTVIIKMDY